MKAMPMHWRIVNRWLTSAKFGVGGVIMCGGIYRMMIRTLGFRFIS